MKQERVQLKPLTSLRFVAAMWVFSFHLYLFHGGKAPAFIDRILLAGPVGMSFFFVLSGFILALTAKGTDPLLSFKHYAARRFARIYPIYLVILLLSWPLIGFAEALGPSPARSATAHAIADLTLTNAWFPQLFSGGLIREGSWSLSVEVFFYATFPFIFFHANRLSDDSLSKACRWAIALTCFFSIMGKYIQPIDPGLRFALFYSMPIFRLPEFAAGVFAGVLASRPKHPVPTAKIAACAALCLILFLAFSQRHFPRLPSAALPYRVFFKFSPIFLGNRMGLSPTFYLSPPLFSWARRVTLSISHR